MEAELWSYIFRAPIWGSIRSAAGQNQTDLCTVTVAQLSPDYYAPWFEAL
jgi:hypothetical protein